MKRRYLTRNNNRTKVGILVDDNARLTIENTELRLKVRLLTKELKNESSITGLLRKRAICGLSKMGRIFSFRSTPNYEKPETLQALSVER